VTAVATEFTVKHNQMVLNDVGYLEAGGKVEFICISGFTLAGASAADNIFYVAGDVTAKFATPGTKFFVHGTTANDGTWTLEVAATLVAGYTNIHVTPPEDITSDDCTGGSITWRAPIVAGPFTYLVIRNLDGTGANDWYAGDAIFNTGYTGDGFMDLYSLRGMRAATEYGPTIVGNVRASSTYNDWGPRFAIGNMNGLYGYSTDLYGAAFGQYASDKANVTIDETNGFRLRSYTTDILQVKNTDGKGYIVGPLYLDTGGGIYQGTGTFASPTTGLKIWNNSGAGRIAGYYGGVPQWSLGTDGVAVEVAAALDIKYSYRMTKGGETFANVYGYVGSLISELAVAQFSIDTTTLTDGGRNAINQIIAKAGVSLYANVDLQAIGDNGDEIVTLSVKGGATSAGSYISATHDLRLGSGLYVGGVGTDPDSDDIWLDGDIRGAGGISLGDINQNPLPGTMLTYYYRILTGNLANEYYGGIHLQPGFGGAYTITIHNYIEFMNPYLDTGAAITDACVMAFDANAGTHKAIDSGSTKTSPGTVSAWIKININGVLYYIPAYTSKTS
jgi:hypothetical protein